MMTLLLEWLVSLTVAGSVIVACSLLLRLLPVQDMPALWRYKLNQLAVVFYLVPLAVVVQWLSPFMTSWFAAAPSTSDARDPGAVLLPEGSSATTIPVSAAALILTVWAVGALSFISWQIYHYRRFVQLLERSHTDVPPSSDASLELAQYKRYLSLKRPVRLAYSELIRTPLLVGLWRPTIYLPRQAAAEMDLGMVLHHELIHLKHKDLWIKASIMCVTALQWFNPLVYLLRREIQTWSELACDEQVVKTMSHQERKRYGQTILSVMTDTRSVPTQFCASLSSEGQHLKRRLTLMLTVKQMKKKTLILLAGSGLLVAALGTSAAVWASDNAPAIEPAPAELSPVTEPAPSKVEPLPAPSDEPEAYTIPIELYPAESSVAGDNASELYAVPDEQIAPEAQVTEARPVPQDQYEIAPDVSETVPAEEKPLLVPAEETGMDDVPDVSISEPLVSESDNIPAAAPPTDEVRTVPASEK
ncbi:M56 family metallopeptidase [Paenibacillus daejeonensis]|uniref:M56 family metallopeptidase n=1 Tax=Paenibacillus daejeonensis TaxID=135193 RepID=UPI00038272C7|nr:M56 family metallopeptidase [Paenibacillus daejeonensis]